MLRIAAMSEAIWLVVKGSQEEGPYTPAQLDNMVRDGRISGSQELRRKGDVKRYTVDQALAVKRQLQKNQLADAAPVSSMSHLIRSTAFRAFLLFVLLLSVGAAALYFTGAYKEPPFAAWLESIGIDAQGIAEPNIRINN
jgi:hypothetical protein